MKDNDLGRRASAEPALVADATGAASVSAHSGDGQAQGCAECELLHEKIADYLGHRIDNTAGELWAAQYRFGCFESRLGDLAGDFDRLTTDDYDQSLEIKGADNDLRLGLEAQQLCKDAGFARVFVCHEDGWETHYNLLSGDLPKRGWRRRYVSDPNASTTRVIAGPADPGYFEISFWPESWTNHKDLESGYMRIVPDPLDPFASADTHPQGGDSAQTEAPFMSGAVPSQTAGAQTTSHRR